MRFFIDRLKVRAAARSMHQYCANVRGIFPRDVDNDIVETATVYLYVQVAREVFSRRFADRMCQQIRENLKYCTIVEANARLSRISHEAATWERAAAEMQGQASAHEEFHRHVTGIIRALLVEGKFLTPENESELLRRAFEPFDHSIRTIKSHLMGIKRQNHFIMK